MGMDTRAASCVTSNFTSPPAGVLIALRVDAGVLIALRLASIAGVGASILIALRLASIAGVGASVLVALRLASIALRLASNAGGLSWAGVAGDAGAVSQAGILMGSQVTPVQTGETRQYRHGRRRRTLRAHPNVEIELVNRLRTCR
jgi:hypothetical protein